LHAYSRRRSRWSRHASTSARSCGKAHPLAGIPAAAAADDDDDDDDEDDDDAASPPPPLLPPSLRELGF
jgi:hypothetical protein